jgi:hypothetical protein
MSIFTISDKHINALVRAAMEFTGGSFLDFTIYICDEPIHYDDPNKMGQVLIDLNRYLVNWKYRENNKPVRYKYQQCKLLSPVQILKACDCYDYQNCNVGVYESTEAGKIIDEIRRFYISVLPGYDEAKWHIE